MRCILFQNFVFVASVHVVVQFDQPNILNLSTGLSEHTYLLMKDARHGQSTDGLRERKEKVNFIHAHKASYIQVRRYSRVIYAAVEFIFLLKLTCLAEVYPADISCPQLLVLFQATHPNIYFSSLL